MRTIGHIDHPVYKITGLQHNNKITLQIEEGLLTQSFVFREGGIVNNMEELKSFCTREFLNKVEQSFKGMRQAYSEQINEQISEDFDVIV